MEETDEAAGERAEAGNGETPMTRAEEIRQRIAERREELRRAAEEQQQSDEAETVDYRSAIQAMMSGRNQNRNSDDEQE